MRKLSIAAVACISLLMLAVPAFAHVTVQPTTAPTGSFFKFDIRVPNEREDADTIRVIVDFPDNLTNVSFQPKAGWERTVTMKTLDEPIEVFGREVTEVIDTVTWEGGAIAPGEFDEFTFTARTPDEPETLVFPSIQVYRGGEEVAWIGEPDSSEPAPRVELVASDGQPGDHATSDEVATEETTAGGGDTSEAASSSGVTVAIVLGALGLIAGLGSLVVALRRR